MQSTNRFDQGRVLRDLGDLPTRLYECLDAGNALARDDLDRSGVVTPVDLHDHGHRHAMLVREGARHAMRARGLGTCVEDQNYSLGLYLPGYFVRILKAYEGGVPGPGYSRSRLDFINQRSPRQLAFVPDESSNLLYHPMFASRREAVHLIFTWTVSRMLELTGVRLSCTKSARTGRGHVDVHWAVPIAHPATRIIAPPVSSSDELDELDEVQHLDRAEDEEGT